mmetsp:Transcript_84/g.182  ORF Transcript_84/g.182 Transcript_84/m.182 type:complete len:216 (-) Transcript_84:165-812(-)|eukprot:CAMPEP_0201937038 /NCGR_PEP_ID=MMETSP0903-20130614/38637_1 /ASSEMBLY_ACC=CAM_ASM_000552 /TAXON_ID=420261 /ORGANISM="Thalassiosira antarctica, Strain CCMP982" /LENGTH=215 /DNA_ID=CAMNT_0048477881 /DNA_START=56 /DNA_END=703 /DNA_ORIENTATION=+
MTDAWVEVPTRLGRQTRKRDDDSDAGDVVVYSSPQRSPGRGGRAFQPFVLVLVGIPGSGKSHFASRLENSMPGNFVRINQDSLGTRRKCETLARRTLAEGKVAVIDRCNFDFAQRKTWIDMAEKEKVHCECIVFQFEKDVCIARCQQRRNHETIHPSKAAGVVTFLAKQFYPPVPSVRNNGGHVECSGGERFHRLERVSSFNMADNLVESYLGQK